MSLSHINDVDTQRIDFEAPINQTSDSGNQRDLFANGAGDVHAHLAALSLQNYPLSDRGATTEEESAFMGERTISD